MCDIPHIHIHARGWVTHSAVLRTAVNVTPILQQQQYNGSVTVRLYSVGLLG